MLINKHDGSVAYLRKHWGAPNTSVPTIDEKTALDQMNQFIPTVLGNFDSAALSAELSQSDHVRLAYKSVVDTYVFYIDAVTGEIIAGDEIQSMECLPSLCYN